jgi:outer membrane immunogenic protein
VLPTGQPIKIGPFVGYNHFHQRINTFGCSQVGANPGICGTVPPFFTPIPTSFDALDADASWNSIRAGVGGVVVLLPGVRASLEAAWIHSWLWNTDYHNFRPDIRAMQQSGEGDGFQLEGLLAYDITPRFSIGLGGRYWRFNASGKNHWERKLAGVLFGIPSAPLDTRSERYGVFLQAGYRFGGPNDTSGAANFGPLFGKAEAEPHIWSGFYVGANVGYGFGDSGIATFAPASPTAALFQANAFIPASQRSDVAGFLGGGQIGYNIQLHPLLVAGVETDIGYANIGGSFGDAHLFTGLSTSNKRLLEWFGTVRGRVGLLARDDMMIYGTGGFAYGEVAAHGAFGTVGINCTFVHCAVGAYSDVATGFAAGAGVEYAIARNFSLKAEWLYVDLGKQSYPIAAFGGAVAFGVPVNLLATSDSAMHVIRTGLNYRLDWPGAAAPVIGR